jgi:LuxR family maltose regulon positive regulatory protein
MTEKPAESINARLPSKAGFRTLPPIVDANTPLPVELPALRRAKMTIPRIADPESIIERPTLVDHIRQATADQFVLISAPAGYGKTTIAVQAVEHIDGPVAWLTLDEQDNDRDLFVAYLTSALLRAHSETHGLRLVVPYPEAAPSVTLDTIINLLGEQEVATTLVLDDYHRIENPSVHQLVEQLIDARSPYLRLIICSRSRPPLPIARARVRHELVEIQTGDLRFSGHETARALSLLLDASVPEAMSWDLHVRTEGWPIGLRLLLLPSTDSKVAYWSAEPDASARSAGSFFVAEYLIEDVLRSLPDSYIAFLMYTSPLKRLTASLCAAMTGASDAQAILTALEQHGLPLFRTGDEGLWYRYHPLVAEVFKQRLLDWHDRSRIAELHREASNWYVSHGYLADAIDHAGECQDWERMIELMSSVGFETLGMSNLQALQSWLTAIPAERRDSDINLSFWYGSVLAAVGRVDESRDYYDRVETSWMESGNHKMIGEVLKHRAFQAMHRWKLEEALSAARRSFQINRLTTAADRSESLYTESVVYSRMGRVREALVTHDLAEREHPLPQVTYIEYGWLLTQAGRLDEAEDALRHGLNFPNPSDPHRRGNIWLAEIYRARGDFDRAEEALDRAAETEFRQRTPPAYPWVSVARAKLHWSAGDAETALSVLNRTIAESKRDPHDLGYRLSSAVKASFLFIQGNVDEACASADELVDEIERGEQHVFIDEQLMRARYLIANERRETALSYLSELSRRAEAEGRVSDRGRILILESLAWASARRTEAAARNLFRAITLLEPGRQITPFSDEGASLIGTLRAVAATGKSLEFVREIVSHATHSAASTSLSAPNLLAEPLSKRELEVLRLVSVGLSNREISEQLFISVPTVKRHVSTIFQKLDATSRTGAVSAARLLKLI